MTFVLGLTGSIGMGKSTTANMFADRGVPVWDADKTVRDLYAPGAPAMRAVQDHYPDAIRDGAVSRPILRQMISDDSKILDHLQTLVHPLVAVDRALFLKQQSHDIVVLDIPLLFEIGADAVCDAVAVVSVPAEVQRTRVMARGEMAEQEFEIILARQMPDAEKRAKARWVIETTTLEHAEQQVENILTEIRKEGDYA